MLHKKQESCVKHIHMVNDYRLYVKSKNCFYSSSMNHGEFIN